MSDSESKRARKPRVIVSDKVDRLSPAYRIVVLHLGGLTPASEILGRNTNTVYGWLLRGQIPTGQQANAREKAAEAGKPFPADWFTERLTAEAA